jgi:hypothetical protein
MAVNACSLTPQQILELTPSDKVTLSAHDIATCFNTGAGGSNNIQEYNREAGLKSPPTSDNVATDYQKQIDIYGTSLYNLPAPISDSTGLPVPTPTPPPPPPPPPPPFWQTLWFKITIAWIIGILWIPSIIMSLLCIQLNNLPEKITGILLALICGPFYWIYYNHNKGYCKKPNRKK